jgi:hypothetical protein
MTQSDLERELYACGRAAARAIEIMDISDECPYCGHGAVQRETGVAHRCKLYMFLLGVDRETIQYIVEMGEGQCKQGE